MSFLSIVIPIYNVEKFLNRCIDSALNQITDDCEIILIDDGSTDGSAAICDEYALKSKLVTVVHQKHYGVSAARNTGILKANGSYILFLDSDDYLSEHSIAPIKLKLKENPCDVFIGTAFKVFENGTVKEYAVHPKIKDGLYTGDEYLKYLKKKSDYSACVWLNIYSRSFLIDNNLFFKEGIIHEDELFIPQILLAANCIHYENIHFYNYCIRNGSIMNSLNYDERSRCMFLVCRELLNLIEKYPCKDTSVIKNEVATIFLQGILIEKGSPKLSETFKKSMPLNNAYFLKMKLKSLLYFISPFLYLIIHKIIKRN